MKCLPAATTTRSDWAYGVLLAAFAAIAMFGPMSARGAVPDRFAYAPGRVLVEAVAGVDDTHFTGTLKRHGAGTKARLYGSRTHAVEVAPGSEAAMLQKLRADPSIKFAELDMLAPAAATTNDPLLANAWHLTKIAAPAAWDIGTGSGVIVAILDTGIDGTHPDLAAQMVGGWNFYDNNSNTTDVQGHGTAVAGAAAAAANNGVGVASVAWGARLMPVRIADANGYAYWSTVAQGLTWAADNGARVANISYLGVSASSTVQSAAQYMRSKGGVVVVSAGNNGIDEGLAPTDTMIVVSATDANDAKTSWSSYGSFVDVAAPGQNIYTTVRGGGYGYWWGTSFASPVVAGVAALVKARRPDFTAAQVESALFSSAVDLGAAGKDPLYGYGRVSAAGAIAASASVPADTTAPVATIAAPAGGTVSGTISVTVNASDNVGVARVDLRVNGTVVAYDTSAPFTFSWNSASVADGAAALTALAVDAAGNVGTSAPVTLTVANAARVVADKTPPAVAITNPAAGAKVSKTSVNVSATASDAGGIASVKLSIDGVVVATGNASPLTYRWNTRAVPTGSHTITVWAQDKAGNAATKTISVTR